MQESEVSLKRSGSLRKRLESDVIMVFGLSLPIHIHRHHHTTMEVSRYNYVLLTQCRERDSRKIYTYWWEGYPPLKDGGTDLMEMLCCKEEFCLI